MSLWSVPVVVHAAIQLPVTVKEGSPKSCLIKDLSYRKKTVFPSSRTPSPRVHVLNFEDRY